MNLKSNKISLGIFSGLLLILLWFLLFFGPGNENGQTNIISKDKIKEIDIEKEQELIFQDYSLKQEARNLPISVIIDNFSQSRPCNGINKAAIIYEAPVEADITRLLAVFDLDNLPDNIGPIRSARPYLAEWAEEYQGLFIHAGGSPEFLQKAESYQIFNLDEISHNGTYFYRDNVKDRPHNLYIEKTNILQAIAEKEIKKKIRPGFVYWSFNNSKQNFVKPPIKLIIKINYREPVIWQYDKETGFYLRFQNNKPFLDGQEEQIKTKNIVIQKTKINIVDNIGHRFIKTQGEGDALIFQKGILTHGYWRKDNKGERTLFYNEKNQEIKFLPGSIWVEIVSPEHEIIY